MATLPLEIIDKIFTSNPNQIVSTYLAFAINHNDSRKQSLNGSKRRKVSHEPRQEQSQEQATASMWDASTIRYLTSRDIIMRYYRESSWLKYFMLLDKPNHTNQKQKVIKINYSREIQEIANYFNLLETYYKHKLNLNSSTPSALENNTQELINRFEKILDVGGFTSRGIDKQLEALQSYYTLDRLGTIGIPAFVKLVLILRVSGYFESSNMMKPGMHNFLEMILDPASSSKISDYTQTYRYYAAVYKFIPLFSVYLGMGYSFVIGWDLSIGGLIGFTEDGGDGHEVMYNIQRAMAYFRQPAPVRKGKYKKLNTKQLQEDYIKMLGERDISILLEYSRRMDICDMLN